MTPEELDEYVKRSLNATLGGWLLIREATDQALALELPPSQRELFEQFAAQTESMIEMTRDALRNEV